MQATDADDDTFALTSGDIANKNEALQDAIADFARMDTTNEKIAAQVPELLSMADHVMQGCMEGQATDSKDGEHGSGVDYDARFKDATSSVQVSLDELARVPPAQQQPDTAVKGSNQLIAALTELESLTKDAAISEVTAAMMACKEPPQMLISVVSNTAGMQLRHEALHLPYVCGSKHVSLRFNPRTSMHKPC